MANKTDNRCRGCGSVIHARRLSELLLCPQCEAKSKRVGKYPTCGWSEPLKLRKQPKEGA